MSALLRGPDGQSDDAAGPDAQTLDAPSRDERSRDAPNRDQRSGDAPRQAPPAFIADDLHSALVAGVSAGVLSFDDLGQFLQKAVTAVHETLDYEFVNLYLSEEPAAAGEIPSLKVVASAGSLSALDDETEYSQGVATGLIGLAARTGEVILSNDVLSDPRYHPRPGTESTRSEICVPLCLDGAVLGVLNVESSRSSDFTERDVRTFSALADQLAMGVGRSRLRIEREARAAELARLKAFNERIVHGIQEGIVVTSPDGTITFANRSFEAMLGYEPGSLVDRRWQALVPPEWRMRLPAMSTGDGRYETRLLRRDGRELAVQVSVRPRDGDGELGTLVVFTDITERVRAEGVARALSEAGLALQAASDSETIFWTLRKQAARTGLRVILSMLDEDSEKLTVRHTSLSDKGVRVIERALGFRLNGLEVSLSLAPPIERLVREGRPTYADDGAELVRPLLPRPAAPLAGAVADRLGMGPTMHVPMYVKGQPIGVVTVSHPDLNESDGSAATVFANQVATAIDRARLHDETEERQRKIAILADLAQHLAASATLERLAEGITEHVSRVFDADAAGLYVYEESRGQLELPAASGFTEEERAVAEATAWARHPGWVIRNRQALLSGNAQQDPRVVYMGSRPRFTSLLYVPLTIEGNRCIGALAVASRRKYAYNPEDLRLVSTLADQVAVAVANALQVREARSRADQLERVSLAGRRIAAHLSAADLLQTSVAEIVRVFEVSHASVFLMDRGGRIELAAHHPRHTPMLDPNARDLEWLATFVRPLAIPDLRDTNQLPGLKLKLIEHGVHSVLVVPIILHSTNIGGILMYATEGRRAFAGPSQDMAAIVAGQIAVAVDNARLYQATDDAKKRVEAVVQSSFTAILTTDTVGRIREVNPATIDLLGIEAANLQGRLLDEALGIDLWLDPDGPIATARRTRAMVAPVERMLPDSPERPESEVLLGVAPLPDGYLISMADITRLKELDRLKSELVANVSHELRSPLASIKAYTELLLDGLVPDPRTYGEFLTVIDNQADRLGQCIGNLLDLARVESEGYKVRAEPFQLGLFVEEVLEGVAVRAEHRRVTLEASFPKEPITLLGDRAILFSLLKNLVDNAVKYSPPGATVRIDASPGPDGLEIAVADEGPGIPQSELPRIFEKFYRVASSNPSGAEGSGLGLVIARQAARAHGGDIRVVSEVGRGSTFSVHLPTTIFDALAAATLDGIKATVRGARRG